LVKKEAENLLTGLAKDTRTKASVKKNNVGGKNNQIQLPAGGNLQKRQEEVKK